MWRQRQGGLSLTRSPSLHELALNHGLTQIQHYQTLQCLWAYFQAVFELWIKALKEMFFASWAFANNSLQFPADCSGCKYIMSGWGFLKTLTCVCFLQHLDITQGSQLLFPWNSTFLPSLKGVLGGFSFIFFPWLPNEVCRCWFVVVLDTGPYHQPCHSHTTNTWCDINVWSDKNLPWKKHKKTIEQLVRNNISSEQQ